MKIIRWLINNVFNITEELEVGELDPISGKVKW